MDRFTATGIALEATGGARVLVVSKGHGESAAAFEACAREIGDWASILRRTNGVRRVDTVGGGRVDFRAFSRGLADAMRGVTLDVVFFEADIARELDREDFLPFIKNGQGGKPAEIVRAGA